LSRDSASAFFRKYDRLVGVVVVFIPAIMFTTIIALGLGVMTIHTAVWLISTYIPLAIFSYYLDIISRVFSSEWVDKRLALVKISILWAVFYPIISIAAMLVRNLVLGVPFMYTLPGLALITIFGAMFGFYFYIAYLYVEKVKKWASVKLQRTRRKE